jgi:hypothetical protein
MDVEGIRLTGLAIFVIWVQVGSPYVLALADGRSSNAGAQCITYGGAVLQVIVCIAAPIAFPGVMCFIAAGVELAAIITIAYIIRGRRQGHRNSKERISSRIPHRFMTFLRKHGIMVCLMAGAGAGFLTYMTPIV